MEEGEGDVLPASSYLLTIAWNTTYSSFDDNVSPCMYSSGILMHYIPRFFFTSSS